MCIRDRRGTLEHIYWEPNGAPRYGCSATLLSPPSEPNVAKHLHMATHRLAVDAYQLGDAELLEMVFDVARKLKRFDMTPTASMMIAIDQHLKNIGAIAT